jgi:hypothetical protein
MSDCLSTFRFAINGRMHVLYLNEKAVRGDNFQLALKHSRADLLMQAGVAGVTMHAANKQCMGHALSSIYSR